MTADQPRLVPQVGLPQAVRQHVERRNRRGALQDVAAAVEATGMRVPVFISELAIAVRLALYGENDGFVRAAAAHQRALLRAGCKGALEQGT